MLYIALSLYGLNRNILSWIIKNERSINMYVYLTGFNNKFVFKY